MQENVQQPDLLLDKSLEFRRVFLSKVSKNGQKLRVSSEPRFKYCIKKFGKSALKGKLSTNSSTYWNQNLREVKLIEIL